MDKVSIVIPVYNGEKYLDECIQSAINQTYQNIEIIAVNDGSTDGSLKILEKYSDKIKIISKENGGTASALNTGISESTGQWIKWLSADDVLYPNAIEELIRETEKLENKERFIMYSNFDFIDSEGQLIGHQNEPNYNKLSNFDFNVILLDHFFGNGTTSLIHKSIIDKFGFFNEGLSFGEDYELWLRYCVLHNCRLHLVPKTLAKYRSHQNQLTKVFDGTGNNVEEEMKMRKSVLEKIGNNIRQKYENQLKNYRKNNWSRDRRMKYGVYNIISKLFSPSYANKSAKIYGKYNQKLRK